MIRRTILAVALSTFAVLIACGGSSIQTADARELPPANPEAVREYNAGLRLVRRGGARNLTRARARFNKALELDPNLWEARYDLGVLQRRAGELRAARESFEAAGAIQPGAEEPLLAAAEAAYAMGEASVAAERLGALVAAHPENLDARISLSVILREAEEYDDALEQAREVLVRDPTRVRALLEIARVYRAREQPEVAELVLQKALALVPEDQAPLRAQVLDEQGLLELSRGDTQAAFEAFDAALAAESTYKPARMNMGSVLLHAGDFTGAAAQYQAVLQADGDDIDARVGLAISLRGQGENARAEREYRRVLETAPAHPDALFDLAVLQAEFLDQRPQSRATFERFLAAAPRRHPAREAAERYLREIPGATP